MDVRFFLLLLSPIGLIKAANENTRISRNTRDEKSEKGKSTLVVESRPVKRGARRVACCVMSRRGRNHGDNHLYDRLRLFEERPRKRSAVYAGIREEGRYERR